MILLFITQQCGVIDSPGLTLVWIEGKKCNSVLLRNKKSLTCNVTVKIFVVAFGLSNLFFLRIVSLKKIKTLFYKI